MSSPLTALVVEDHAFTRTLLTQVLAGWGFAVSAAADGSQAWRIAKDHRPDLAVIDVHLGTGPHGYEVLSVLRRSHPDLPALLVTNYRADEAPPTDEHRHSPNTLFMVKSDIRGPGDLRDAVAALLGRGEAPVIPAPATYSITRGQAEILRLIAEGMSNDQIAEARVTTKRAVELSIQRLYRALELDNTTGNARIQASNIYRTAQVAVR